MGVYPLVGLPIGVYATGGHPMGDYPAGFDLIVGGLLFPL